MDTFEEGRKNFDTEYEGKDYRVTKEGEELESGEKLEEIKVYRLGDNPGIVARSVYQIDGNSQYTGLSRRSESDDETETESWSEEVSTVEDIQNILNGKDMEGLFDSRISNSENESVYSRVHD